MVHNGAKIEKGISMTEQTPYEIEEQNIRFDVVEFAENPEPRCPCILLLDCSGSMNGKPIQELNNGLHAFQQQLSSDDLASKRVEVTVVKFDTDVEIINEFETAENFTPRQLEANGLTSMGRAIERAVNLLEQRKAVYKANGISYYRPWIFLLTDGEPTDDYTNAMEAIHEGEKNKQFAFFAVGIQGANMDILRQISVRQPLPLQGLNFTSLFQWLSNSMSSVSRSSLDAEIALESPSGWAKI